MPATQPIPLDGLKIKLLQDSGTVWSLAELVVNDMKVVQQALLGGDVKTAQTAFDRGRRMVKRLNEAFEL